MSDIQTKYWLEQTTELVDQFKELPVDRDDFSIRTLELGDFAIKALDHDDLDFESLSSKFTALDDDDSNFEALDDDDDDDFEIQVPDYNDFKIICEGDRTFHCHLLLLAAGSEYFEEQLRKGSKSLTITEYDAPVMEQIINFIYKDTIKFTRTYPTVYDLLVAAEFFQLRRLDLVDELCVEFISGEASAIPDTVGLFSYIMPKEEDRTVLMQGLSRHIMTFIDEFAEDELTKFGVDKWKALLSQRWYLPAGKETHFLRLFSHALDRPEERDKRSCLDESTIRRMVFGYYSDEYRLWLSKRFAEPSKTQWYQWTEMDWQDEIATCNLPALHLYVTEGPSAKIRVLSASRASPSSWMESTLDTVYYSHESMLSVASGDGLYRLGYAEKRFTFLKLNSAVGADVRKLAPPPVVHAHFELCGTREFIYLTTFGAAVAAPPTVAVNKHLFSEDSDEEGSVESLTDESVPRVDGALDLDNIGLYRYRIETDTWFPVRLPTTKRYRVAMVTSYEGNMYLIAKTSKKEPCPILYRLDENDPLKSQELKKCGLEHYEGKITCCGHDGRFYVCSSSPGEEPKIERYHLQEGKWEYVAPLPADVGYVYRLLSFENWVWAIAKSAEHDTLIVKTYNSHTETWEPSPFKKCLQDFTGSSLQFLDSFIFK